MRILAVSDVVNGILYSHSLKEAVKDVDVIVSCGDLPAYYLDFLVSHLSKPLLYVCGNHDHYGLRKQRSPMSDHIGRKLKLYYGNDEDEQSFGGINLDNRVQNIGNVLFTGLEGSKVYNYGDHQYSEGQMKRKIRRLAPSLLWNKLFRGRYMDILVTHAPPKGIHDGKDRAHEGFKSYLNFIRRYRPKYLLHGHTHIYDQNENRIFQYYDTTIINCYNYQIIDLDGKTGLG